MIKVTGENCKKNQVLEVIKLLFDFSGKFLKQYKVNFNKIKNGFLLRIVKSFD